MLHAVIMAGGKGTRFWPLSRERRPKQLLKIVGDRTMIQATVDRIAPLVPPERVLIVTGASHADEIKKQLPELPEKNIIVEPAGRNTAPCVALAAMIVKKRDPEGVMAVFPADHVIQNPDALIKTIEGITNVLENNPGVLATIGIKPGYPETGYGYIKQGHPIEGPVSAVEKFLEKPDAATADEYVKSGRYLWNSGMFFWRADTILAELRENMPRLMEDMAIIDGAVGTPMFEEIMEQRYASLTSISIDYAVMEHAGGQGKAVVAVADPGWNDVGSWRSLYDLAEPDERGNIHRGELLAIDAKGVAVHNENRLVAAIGLENVIIIETDDAILVCHKDRAQDVRRITEMLREKGHDGLL